ncbi:tetratricopeptide repeat protein [Sorangium sp. So ce296]|uniref:tetratricopeptide repeat protein n=1 Tax=Sorangium sp. So ce296 TaxID=3133296 RepID=UPI003F60E9FC
MSGTPIINRDEEPAILLVARRMSGKSSTRASWNLHLRMEEIRDNVAVKLQIDTKSPEATSRIEEYRIKIDDRYVRVLDVPGEIVNPRNEMAGTYREQLEQVAGRIGAVLICVPPPALKQSEAVPRAGFVHPSRLRLYQEQFKPFDDHPQPSVPHIEEVRERIDSAMAFCEQALSRLRVSAATIPFAVQMGFADLVFLGDTDAGHEEAKSRLYHRYRAAWPEPNTWTNPESINARMRVYEEIDRDVSGIFEHVSQWMRERYRSYQFYNFAASNRDASLGHHSPVIGFAYLVDQMIGRQIMAAERGRRDAEGRANEMRGSSLRALGFVLAVVVTVIVAAMLSNGQQRRNSEYATLRPSVERTAAADAPPVSSLDGNSKEQPRPGTGPVDQAGGPAQEPRKPAERGSPSKEAQQVRGQPAEVARRFRGGMLRQAPALGADPVEEIDQGLNGISPGTRLSVLERSSDSVWLHVSHARNGASITGWMHRNVVTFLPAPAPEDVNFEDLEGGKGWSDRCYEHLKDLRLSYAKAACSAGLGNSPSRWWKASLLYNMGRIAAEEGDWDVAREYYEKSIAEREQEIVRRALENCEDESERLRCRP